MMSLLNCTKELAQKIKDTFGDRDIKFDYNLDNGLYDVIFASQFYVYHVSVQNDLMTMTRMAIAGNEKIVTLSFDTKHFWKLEVY